MIKNNSTSTAWVNNYKDMKCNPKLKIENLFLGVSPSFILKHICFEIEGSGIVFLTGPNGSGKSSLLKCCAGVSENYEGILTVNGNILKTIPIEKRPRLISWLPQKLHRPEGFTLRDFYNFLGTPLPEYILADFELENIMENRLDDLSGGEWKRAMLCHVFQSKAPFLFLDEPDGDLDEYFQMKLKVWFETYRRMNNALVFVATHKKQFIEKDDVSTMFINEGRLVYCQKPRGVFLDGR